MSKAAFCAIAVTALVAATARPSEPTGRVYELRVETARAGKLAALSTRTRDKAMKLYQRHGIQVVGVFTPADGAENKLYGLFRYPTKDAREASWKVCLADPEYKSMIDESNREGKLVAKSESTVLVPTGYSPEVKAEAKGERVFELRTYTTPVGMLPDLHARFRDHTLGLFEKHGMTNVGYWVPIRGQKDDDITLVYLLAHKSVDAAQASKKAFSDDPAWIAARSDSERKAGGPLTVRNGIKHVFLKPTDYSPLR